MNHNPKNSFEARQRALIEDNINVSKTNEVKDLFILLAGVIAIIFVLIFSFDLCASIYIDKMPYTSQSKIEETLEYIPQNDLKILQNHKEYSRIEKIKNNIIQSDKLLNNKLNPQILIWDEKEVNAFVLPTGIIYLTTGLLQEKGLTDEELTFVLAHEIGHYRNKDHLKAISHNIGIMVITGLIGMNTNSTSNSTISSIGEMGSLAYSRKQETNADIYANETLIKIYGTNNGAIKFINRIKEKNSEPEFLKYFSTHPSWNDRLEISNSIQNK